MDIRNFNWKTLLALLTFIAGILIFIYWGTRYGVWTDIGIYTLTIVLVLFGVFGILLSLTEPKEEKTEV
ncbi:MAG: hypothetical protein EHM79_19260 [Geobacter sp.]|nr:MAG: hypothetical protein EHM79_19260 [Geobacter sp.]